MKIPKFPKLFAMKPRKKLHTTTARRAAPPVAESYDDEPQTKLSSAFIVVLILHVVAVGGIYAFNSIKARRQQHETQAGQSSSTAKTASLRATAKHTDAAAGPSSVEGPPSLIANAPAASGTRIHHVKSGDNLTKISSQYNVSITDLERANGAKKVATLHPGQSLTIPPSIGTSAVAKKTEEVPKLTAAASPKASPKSYIVAKGDNPVAIARKLGVSYDELLKLNKIADPKKLKPGQTLQVPAKKTN